MKKPKITMTVTKESTGYSVTAKVQGNFIGTQGESLEELKSGIGDAVNLAFEDKGWSYTMDEIILKPDQ